MEPAKIFQSVAQQACGVGWVSMVGGMERGRKMMLEDEDIISMKYDDTQMVKHSIQMVQIMG